MPKGVVKSSKSKDRKCSDQARKKMEKRSTIVHKTLHQKKPKDSAQQFSLIKT